MTTQTQFFEQHAVDGVLPPELMTQFLNMDPGAPAVVDATTVEPTTEKTPTEPSEADKNAEKTPTEPTEQELTADNAVIASKNGKYTIGYDKLVEARTEAATFKAQAEQLRQQLEAATAAQAAVKEVTQAAAAPGANPGGPKIDPAKLMEGVDFGDYSDSAIASAVAAMVEKGLAMVPATAAAPAVAAVDPAQAHYTAIYGAHPDADDVAQSAELATWLQSQPGIARAAYQQALTQGSADQVIEVFSTFKAATGRTGEAGQPDALAAAQAAITAAKAKPPTSLTDVSAGSSAHHNEQAAMLDKSPEQAMAMFGRMTPEQIEAALRRTL